jgi:serine/threonine-protein kinase
MTDIPAYPTFAKIEPINKGWSSDKKYYIETRSGERFLLRMSDIAEYDRKRAEFDMLKRVAELDIPASRPVEFGTCDAGKSVYQRLTWIDGEDAEKVLPTLSEAKQYALGVKAGEILRKMQSLSVVPASSDWLNAYGTKIDRYICNYKNCGLTFDGDSAVMRYLEYNRHLMDNRPMCFSHDNYHPGNMILTPEKELFIIDFQRFRQVEPYHTLSGLVFSAAYSPKFATGEIRGYFGGEPPEDFWGLLALYFAAIAINALPWSIPFGETEMAFGKKQIADIMHWYDDFTRVVPTWYLRDFHVQYIDGVEFRDIKTEMDSDNVRRMISYAAFDGSPEGVRRKVQQYQNDNNLCFYGYLLQGELVGICGFEEYSGKIEIHLIAVDYNSRGTGIGTAMITELEARYCLPIEAETDDDAIGFYQKAGFYTSPLIHPVRGKRWTCVKLGNSR